MFIDGNWIFIVVEEGEHEFPGAERHSWVCGQSKAVEVTGLTHPLLLTMSFFNRGSREPPQQPYSRVPEGFGAAPAPQPPPRNPYPTSRGAYGDEKQSYSTGPRQQCVCAVLSLHRLISSQICRCPASNQRSRTQKQSRRPPSGL